jgi:hypothetical protein
MGHTGLDPDLAQCCLGHAASFALGGIVHATHAARPHAKDHTGLGMSNLYRHVDENGQVTYTDRPSTTSGQLNQLTAEGRQSPQAQKEAHDEAVKYIREAQKRIPKIKDYLDYLGYLRNNHAFQFERVLKQLAAEDPDTWRKLQKYPQFRPLRDTLLGVKAGEKNLSAGLGLATGNITGSAEKWLETSLKDMMKRDRFGPYADVLGSKATTLPAPKPPTYSNSRLGQYLKAEDPKAAQAAKLAAAGLQEGRAAVRSGFATSVSRVGGVVVDVGLGALDVQTFDGISAIRGGVIARDLQAQGILDEMEALELPGMMARHEFDKARALIEAGRARAAARPQR